jgi:hypothetical protein
MEQSGRNQWQLIASATRPKTLECGDRQPLATAGNLPSFDGKEGVDGSSPSEGSAKAPLTALFL